MTCGRSRAAITAQIAEAFAPYAVDGGYELPGGAFCAAAYSRSRQSTNGGAQTQ